MLTIHLLYSACSPVVGTTLTFPAVENENIRKYFYYTVSTDCMRIDACLDVTVEELNIGKTFTAYIVLDPCHYVINLALEKWTKTLYLIDYEWGT